MYTSARDRVVSALASLLIVAGGVAALVAGLAAQMTPKERREALAAVLPLRNEPEEPRPKETPAKARSTAAKGRPSPPNLRNKATQIVAPPARVPPLIVPPPVVTAPRAGTGAAAQSGAADRAGPGQGAGGIGDGDGGGGDGNGDGEGDDALTRPEQIRGRLRFSDLPRDLREGKTGGELKLRYRIGVDGRVSDCRILVSSGRPSLDATTCRLITERFRFRPSRNSRGEPVPAIMVETHGWYFDPEEDLP
ncbi:energy transducer TonB [Novosphingobium panipatense]|uniref:energy transducer TonB n=1 Tax=Novosphingobium TaxID=165696 RepID=UPI000CDAE0FA|nr:energy transducer TonB [Novosphingobium sp. HII-3]